MIPTRIQRSRAKGAKLPPGTLCCTRPGRWANPFRVVKHEPNYWRVHIQFGAKDTNLKQAWMTEILTRQAAGFSSEPDAIRYAIECFRLLIEVMPDTYPVEELRKYKRLACWCALDKPCHVDVLIQKLTKP
jgi:hypothetical protein